MTTDILTRPRLIAAWSRVGGKDGWTPSGRIHATVRDNGALVPEALCGVRLPEKALRRPYAMFDTDHPNVCKNCVKEATDASE